MPFWLHQLVCEGFKNLFSFSSVVKGGYGQCLDFGAVVKVKLDSLISAGNSV